MAERIYKEIVEDVIASWNIRVRRDEPHLGVKIESTVYKHKSEDTFNVKIKNVGYGVILQWNYTFMENFDENKAWDNIFKIVLKDLIFGGLDKTLRLYIDGRLSNVNGQTIYRASADELLAKLGLKLIPM